MSVGQKSIHAVNEQIDVFPGVLDSKTMNIAKQALDDLSKRDLTSSMDKIELSALSSKIEALPLVDEKGRDVSKSLISKVIGAFGWVCKSRESLDSLSSAFLSKAGLTEEEALQVEDIFLKSLKERDEVLLAVSSFIKEGEDHTKNKLTTQETIDLLRRIQKIPREEGSSVCSNALHFLSKGMEGNQILSLLDSVERIPQKDREEVCSSAAGSSCTYEYADGAEGVTNGVFTIKDARKIEVNKGEL